MGWALASAWRTDWDVVTFDLTCRLWDDVRVVSSGSIEVQAWRGTLMMLCMALSESGFVLGGVYSRTFHLRAAAEAANA